MEEILYKLNNFSILDTQLPVLVLNLLWSFGLDRNKATSYSLKQHICISGRSAD